MSKVMTAYTQRDRLSSAEQNSGRKIKLRERHRQELKRIVVSKELPTAAKVTTELNQHLDSPLLLIIFRRHLDRQNIYGKHL